MWRIKKCRYSAAVWAVVDMAGQWRCTALGSPHSVHTGGRWVQIKPPGYAPPRNWDAWGGAGKLSAWLAWILWFYSSQQSPAFDGTCQVSAGLRGRSSPVLWLDSCQHRDCLHLPLETWEQQGRAGWVLIFRCGLDVLFLIQFEVVSQGRS